VIASTLIKNVDIVFLDQILSGDILIKDGKIAKIAASLSDNAEVILNESGLTLFAGNIDTHVHFRDPGATYKEDINSGSIAAASGGVTTFFDMPNTNPSTTTIEALEAKKEYAKCNSIVNYNFFIGATHDNLNHLKQAQNIPGIKIYVGSSTGELLVDNKTELEQIFSQTKHTIAVHSEDEQMIQERLQTYKGSSDVIDHEKIRSAEGALKCTKMLIELAQKTNHHLHICHLTTKQEVDLLRGLGTQSLITSEVSPQHLLTYAPNVYDKWGTKAQINPPIRHQNHQRALFLGLQEGVIDFIASDHAPHTNEEKDQAFGKAPSGMPGVETSFPLLLNCAKNGFFNLNDITKRMAFMPAKIYNIQNKGLIKENFDADLVLVDLNSKYEISKDNLKTKCKWSIFEGQKITGKVVATFVNGQVVYREGDVFEDVKGKEVRFNF
jgi:dihydroorotase